VIGEIKELLPNYPVRPVKEFMTLMTSTNIPALQTFINSMIALAVSIGLLVIFLSMYTTVLERTRDIGVAKIVGCQQIPDYPRPFGGNHAALSAGNIYGHRPELCGAGRLPEVVSDTFDFDHRGMDPTRGADRYCGRVDRRELPGVAG